jgi:hypothetical protein
MIMILMIVIPMMTAQPVYGMRATKDGRFAARS